MKFGGARAGRETHESRPARRASARSALRLVGGVLLGCVALLGVCSVLLALAPVVGMKAVMLQTGSMSPGYPAGSVLLARDAAPDELTVGDIVTVSRGDGAVVTHRVVAVELIPGGANLTLRGDANQTDDPRPYTVSRVGLILGGVPWGGQLISLLQQPGAAVAVAGGVSLLVLWAWWPTRSRPAHRAGRGVLA